MFRDVVIGLIVLMVWEMLASTMLGDSDADVMAQTVVPVVIIVAIIIRAIVGALGAFSGSSKD